MAEYDDIVRQMFEFLHEGETSLHVLSDEQEETVKRGFCPFCSEREMVKRSDDNESVKFYECLVCERTFQVD